MKQLELVSVAEGAFLFAWADDFPVHVFILFTAETVHELKVTGSESCGPFERLEPALCNEVLQHYYRTALDGVLVCFGGTWMFLLHRPE